MITFDAKLFAAVSCSVNTEEVRYYLNGVHMEGQLAVATDGHILTVAYDENAIISEPGIYPVAKAIRTKAKSAKAETIRIDGGLIEVLANASYDYDVLATDRIKPIDGTFPAWRKVLPTKATLAPTGAAFSNLVIAHLLNTAAALNGSSRAVSLTFRGKDTNSPHLVKYGSDERLFSVIMPIRYDGKADAFPAWLDGAPSAAKLAKADNEAA